MHGFLTAINPMVSWLMLLAQYCVIVVYGYGPLVSWWVFVSMLIILALLYLGRLFGGTWRQPERLADAGAAQRAQFKHARDG